MSRRPLSDQDIEAALVGLEWHREGDELVRAVTLPDFASALAWVNRVGDLAEGLNHHPDISIRWNVVTLRVTTHSEHALTEADVELASAVDSLS
jgi:4a-hydroxytetrahydrobiopterin dehydratase